MTDEERDESRLELARFRSERDDLLHVVWSLVLLLLIAAGVIASQSVQRDTVWIAAPVALLSAWFILRKGIVWWQGRGAAKVAN